jgi:predicted RND superfamily exporter protein
MPSSTLRRWSTLLIRYRYGLLAIAAVLGVGGALVGRQLTLNRSLENMFAPDDPILVPYQRLQRTFGQHEIVLAVYADPQLKSPAGVQRLAGLVEKLRNVPGVVSLVSLADLPSATDFGNDNRGQRFREVFAGYTHNAPLDAAGVIALTERPGPGKPSRHEILSQMRSIIEQYPQGALVGETVLVEEGFDMLEHDGRRLNTWCMLLVMLTILVCFRSVRWLVLPLAVILFTQAITNATLVVSGLELSMVSSMLGAIITVVGVASVVHFMVHYQDERRHGCSRRRAMLNTFDELAIPVFVAIITDAAGFAALMVSRVDPIHDFGFMMALGSLMVLPACLLIVPGLAWLCDRDAHSAPVDDRLSLGRWLARLLAWSNRHIVGLAVAAAALVAWALVGSTWLELETDFTKSFRSGSRIVSAYDFVETRFGGAGVWDLLVPAPANINKAQLLKTMDLEKDLQRGVPELTKAISLADMLAAGLNGASGLKLAPDFALGAGLRLMRGRMLDFVNTLYNVDPADGRPWVHVLLRSPERLDAHRKTQIIDEVQTTAAATFPQAQATGYYVLLASLIQSLLADQWKAFLVATAVVGAMISVAIRDWRLTAVTFVPNIFPSLVLFGAMGWLGLRVNMGAAMIAAVSVGMSVDGSVHYTMFYQRLRRAGLSLQQALDRSQDCIGRAAVFSTLALTVGFATLCVSDFIPTVYFGVLVSLSMIGGLIGNIVVLPVLIRLVDKRLYN